MPSVIQRGTETFRIRSVATADVPSTRRRNVPEGRWVLREAFSIETTRSPPTTPATQRRTCSLGNLPFAVRLGSWVSGTRGLVDSFIPKDSSAVTVERPLGTTPTPVPFQ